MSRHGNYQQASALANKDVPALIGCVRGAASRMKESVESFMAQKLQTEVPRLAISRVPSTLHHNNARSNPKVVRSAVANAQ